MRRLRSARTALVFLLVCMFGSLHLASSAQAQFPEREVRIVVPARGAAGVSARLLADELTRRWGKPVIVVEMPGAAGIMEVAGAPPDGHTLLLQTNTAPLVKPAGSVPASSERMLPITQIAEAPLVLLVTASAPFQNVASLIEGARRAPDSLTIGYVGNGSTSHRAWALLMETAKISGRQVPYKVGEEVRRDVEHGVLQAAFLPLAAARAATASGKVRALAVTSPVRTPQLPDVPTFKEAGVPDMTYQAWYGLMAPAGTPQFVVAQINRDVGEIVRSGTFGEKLGAQSVNPSVSGTPDSFRELLEQEKVLLGIEYHGPGGQCFPACGRLKLQVQ